jgi:TRAP-type C4-dicarboxylate transport system permease small subunit
MLAKVEEWVLIIALSAMSLLAFYQVATRYVFTSLGFTWVEELVRHLFVVITFVGAGAVMRKKGHQGVEILSSLLPGRLEPYHGLYASLCGFIFSAAAAYVTLYLLLEQRAIGILTTATRLPMYVVTIPMVVGFVLMTYYAVREIVCITIDLVRGRKEEKP